MTRRENEVPPRRGNRLLREMDHDPYRAKKKLPDSTVCPECSAVFQKGRWRWAPGTSAAQKELCPACRRIKDRVPAGFLSVSGDFFGEHKNEIMNLIRNIEEQKKAEHPLERIMDIDEKDDTILVSFTGAHIARGAGEALHHAYQGELDFQYTDEDILLRVSWKR